MLLRAFSMVASRKASENSGFTRTLTATMNISLLSHARRGQWLAALEKVNRVLQVAVALIAADRELAPGVCAGTLVPQRGPAVLAVFPQHVKIQIDILHPLFIVVEVPRHALESVERGLFRSHAVPHILHNGMRAGH